MTSKKDELLAYIENNPNTYARYIEKSRPDLFELIKSSPGSTNPEKAYNFFNPDALAKFSNCKICNKSTSSFITFKKGYRVYCSNACASNDSDTKIAKMSGFRSDEAKEKRKVVLKERYGTDSLITINRAKSIATCQSKYGVDYPFQSKEISDKIDRKQISIDVANNLRKQNALSGKFAQMKANTESRYSVTGLFDEQDYIDGKPFMWKHCCGEVMQGFSHFTSFIIVCPKCRGYISTFHREVLEFIKSLNIQDYSINDRSIIEPYELDIYLPSHKLALELDGVYWHQDENYSKSKLDQCAELGIRLLHITDISWYKSPEIWKSIIRSKLGMNTKIHARQCTIHDVEPSIAKKFFDDNHLQSSIYGNKTLGLKIDGNYVAMMSFGKPRFNNSYQWELLRFANIMDYSVVGGASKLLAAFRKQNVGSIISYAKKEHSNGNLYNKLGFVLLRSGSNSYYYLGKSGDIVSRYQAQKHNLSNLLGSGYDPDKTEKANMQANGYMLIQDRGSMTWILK